MGAPKVTSDVPLPGVAPAVGSPDPAGGPLLRPRLLKRLRLGLRARLMVLEAPAGFGKSVLVDQLAAAHHASPAVPVRLRYGGVPLWARVLLIVPGSEPGGRLRVRGWPPGAGALLGDGFLEPLRRRLAGLGDVVLVLDLSDTSQGEVPAGEVSAFVDRAPANLHVLLACPPPALGAPTVADRCDTVVLGAADLAFTGAEARLLVRQVGGLALSDDRLAVLMARTAGWPLAVRATALALRDAADPDAVLAGGQATDRQLIAFLHDEVLNRQPGDLRRFLARASVLEALTAPLAVAVTGEPAAGAMLRSIARDGAFVRPTGPEEPLAFCALFREALQRELRVTEPDAEGTLLAAAAAWHSERGEPEPAAAYLARAGRFDELLGVLDRHGPVLFEQGAGGRILGWLDTVPPDTPGRRRRIGLRRALVLTLGGETRRAAQLVRALDGPGRDRGDGALIDVLRTTWAFWDAAPAAALEASDAALAVLEDEGTDIPEILGMTGRGNLRLLAGLARARTRWYLGEVDAARRELTALTRDEDGYRPWRAQVLSALAQVEAWAGNLNVAERHARDALSVAAPGGPLDDAAVADAYVALAAVGRERGDLADADEMLQAAEALAVRSGREPVLAMCTVERALGDLAAGQPERGILAIRARHRAGEAPPPIVAARLRAAEVRLWLALGDGDRAERMVRTTPQDVAPGLAAAAVQSALARRDVAAARARLVAWPDAGVLGGMSLERDLWEAVVDLEEGRRRQALRRASLLVAEAETQGHRRLFLDAGEAAARLLRGLVNVEPSPYAAELAGAFGAPAAATGPTPLALSAREREVVRYLPTPLSSAQIAGQLYISLNTLKTHLRTIYGKLGVNGRREAIDRAQELGIA